MKKATLITIAAAVMLTAPISEASPSRKVLEKARKNRSEQVIKAFAPTKNSSNKRKAPLRAASEANWLPTAQILSEWYDGAWEQTAEITTVYTPEGLTALETYKDSDGFAMRENNKYNENGRNIEQFIEVSNDGEEFENSTLARRSYDPRITSLIVKNESYIWMAGEWQKGSNDYIRTVTRNADGNVTEVVVSTFFNGNYSPMEKLHVIYGDDGKATTIKNEILSYNWSSDTYYWEDGEEYSNIVWAETDGQFGEMGSFCTGTNRFLSATYTSEGEVIGDMTVKYTDNGYTASIEQDGMLFVETASTPDSFGSFSFTSTISFHDDDEDIDVKLIRGERATYDTWGHELEYYASEITDLGLLGSEEDIIEWNIGTVNMAEGKPYPSSYCRETFVVSDEDDEDLYARSAETPAGEWENIYMVEYTQWSNLSGISDITAEDTDAPAEYFNLQGIRVTNPANGLYIRRQGRKAEKVVL